jgi:phage gpG-like protein
MTLKEQIVKWKNNKPRLMREIGELVVNDALKNFKDEAFEGQKWKPRKDGSSTGDRGGRRNLLVKSGKLRRSIRVTKATANSVSVGSDVPYAKIHNEGGVTNPKVTPRSRRFFWAMYKKTGNPRFKAMATTKQNSFRVNIPARPFLKITPKLKEKIKAKINETIFKGFKVK